MALTDELDTRGTPMTRAESEAMHEMAAAFGGRSITAYDMAGCPKRIWLHQHYREDAETTCRCDELDQALADLEVVRARWADDPARMRHQLMEAELNVRYCGGDL